MSLIAGVWLLAAAAAHAAPEAAPAGGGLQEVIVTAQKRSESEQTVPMSITTFSSQALEAKAINDFFDYATKVPNLAFAPTGDDVGTARTISIRGISGNDVTGFTSMTLRCPTRLIHASGYRPYRSAARPQARCTERADGHGAGHY
jgi:outer membrane receptor protein involved in Fe transport